MRRAGPEDFPTCSAIRFEVFVDEQQVPKDLELDAFDAHATHFLAFAGGRAVGTARLRTLGKDAKAERVAVLASERVHGVGRALMQEIEREATRLCLPRVVLNAQVSVVAFYECLGYRAEGETFDEAGIPHQRMTKPL